MTCKIFYCSVSNVQIVHEENIVSSEKKQKRKDNKETTGINTLTIKLNSCQN